MRERTSVASGPGSELSDDLETTMQKVSMAISIAAITLMLGGVADAVLLRMPMTLPGVSAQPLGLLGHPPEGTMSLAIMSAGLVLLALLPTLRVGMALALYIRRRHYQDALVALIVLLELLASMRAR